MHISRPVILVSVAALALCSALVAIVLITSNRGDSAATHPRRYLDYDSTTVPVDQCSLPLAQRTGGWSCYG